MFELWHPPGRKVQEVTTQIVDILQATTKFNNVEEKGVKDALNALSTTNNHSSQYCWQVIQHLANASQDLMENMKSLQQTNRILTEDNKKLQSMILRKKQEEDNRALQATPTLSVAPQPIVEKRTLNTQKVLTFETGSYTNAPFFSFPTKQDRSDSNSDAEELMSCGESEQTSCDTISISEISDYSDCGTPLSTADTNDLMSVFSQAPAHTDLSSEITEQDFIEDEIDEDAYFEEKDDITDIIDEFEPQARKRKVRKGVKSISSTITAVFKVQRNKNNANNQRFRRKKCDLTRKEELSLNIPPFPISATQATLIDATDSADQVEGSQAAPAVPSSSMQAPTSSCISSRPSPFVLYSKPLM